jgi:hypothetical protein
MEFRRSNGWPLRSDWNVNFQPVSEFGLAAIAVVPERLLFGTTVRTNESVDQASYFD